MKLCYYVILLYYYVMYCMHCMCVWVHYVRGRETFCNKNKKKGKEPHLTGVQFPVGILLGLHLHISSGGGWGWVGGGTQGTAVQGLLPGPWQQH